MEHEMMPDNDITPSSGNLFADLGLPNPDEYDLKEEEHAPEETHLTVQVA